MQPDGADLTLTFIVPDDEKPTRVAARDNTSRLRPFPEGMGTMISLTEGSSLRGTIFNLVNTMIGGGILGLPFAIEQMGILLGGLLLVLNAMLQDLTVWMLLVSVDETREKSYSMVAEVLYNQSLGVLVDVAVTSNNLGVLVSYVVIIGDVLPPFMSHIQAPDILQDRNSIVLLIALTVLLPLSSMRSMGALRNTSLVCLLMILVLVVIIVAMGLGFIDVAETTDSPATLFSSDPVSIFGQLPVLVFAYNCNMNVPILYGELRRQKSDMIDSKFRTKRSKMMLGMHISAVACALIYGCVSIFGYYAFRNRTAHDILTNLQSHSFSFAPYVKAAYSVVIVCSFPVMCFSCVASLHRLILHCGSVFRDEPSPRMGGYALFQATSPGSSPASSPPSSPRLLDHSPDVFASPYACPGETYLKESPMFEAGSRAPRLQPPSPSKSARQLEVIGVLLISVSLGISFPDVSVIFGLTGGLCGGSLSFIFPGLFYMRVARSRHATSLQLLRGPWLGQLVVCIGVVTGIGSTGVIAWQTAVGKH